MPSIIPSFGPRPTTPTHSYTVVLTGPTATIGAGQVIFGDSIDTPGQMPGPYYNPSYGSPLVHVRHEFVYDWRLVNEGTIWVYSSKFSATAVQADRLTNRGLIVGEIAIPYTGPSTAIFGYVYGARIGGSSGTDNIIALDNSGAIHAKATGGNAFAVWSDSVPLIINSGVIAAQSTYSPDHSTSGGAFAVRLVNGGRIVNQAGGSILAEGPTARAVFLGRGLSADPQLNNAGLIEAVSTDPTRKGIAVMLTNIQTETIEVHNSGTIRADIAIYAPSSSTETFTSFWQVNVQTIRTWLAA